MKSAHEQWEAYFWACVAEWDDSYEKALSRMNEGSDEVEDAPDIRAAREARKGCEEVGSA